MGGGVRWEVSGGAGCGDCLAVGVGGGERGEEAGGGD